jgi:hypothetical protein
LTIDKPRRWMVSTDAAAGESYLARQVKQVATTLRFIE